MPQSAKDVYTLLHVDVALTPPLPICLLIQGVDPLRTRYFIAANNLDEWADLADAVGLAMLGMFVEYDCYEVVKEMKRAGQDSGTVIGRINKYHDQKAKGLDVLLPKHVSIRHILTICMALTIFPVNQRLASCSTARERSAF